MNHAHRGRPSLACAILASGFVACGSGGEANGPDGGSSDATANSPRDGAETDPANGYDASQDAGIDANSRDFGPDKDAEAGAVFGDSDSSVLDADDAAVASACEGGASLPADASLPAVHVCSFHDGGAEFPLFAKCCASTADCAIGVYQNSCCGDTFALGLNKSQVAAFGQAVANWSCAACGCASSGLHTEDGKPGVTDAGVRCDNGWCVSYGR